MLRNMTVPYGSTVITEDAAGSADLVGSAAFRRFSNQPLLMVGVGAATISASPIFVVLSGASPVSTAFYRSLIALPVLIALAALWRPLLAITVHEELAQVEGVNVGATRLAFMLLVALVIAVAMKVVGVLLITALLILPAAAARRFARTPEAMAAFAALAGALAVLGGVAGSLRWDLPTGPAIVLSGALLFALSLAWPRRLSWVR